ncbi:hypothetical protein KQY30_01070 [Streptomyces sp. GMY02]|uniref:DUF5947 family protein n=1 Tax=Streptomyces sp. GMY02 TaxID=1333528 RepID=UPI001C2B9D80|nr:DUF5947 family protein [Streptomyces sp. GMY02]QXE33096.1 hypothetical protein KQY30_01070 [Streptomyces sp. GMY02]
MTTRPAPGPDGLRGFTRRPPPAEKRCELCAEPLPGEHRHLVDTRKRSLLCACAGCHLLFTRPGAGAGRFRAVPDRYLSDPDFVLDEESWSRLQIPVGLAFFFRNSELDRTAAFYPSPAGATESELDPATWQEVLGSGRLAALLQPDTEALLIRRERGTGAASTGGAGGCWLVPVDVCYELVGRMRLRWQGFDGGAEARAELADFFARVAARARPPTTEREDGR